MITSGYLILWLIALIAAVLMALGTHYLHAHFSPYPDKLIDGYRWRDHALNTALNSEYHWWSHYDEDGWWVFWSWRNYVSHAVGPVALVLIVGATQWSNRTVLVAGACKSLGTLKVVPLFCG